MQVSKYFQSFIVKYALVNLLVVIESLYSILKLTSKPFESFLSENEGFSYISNFSKIIMSSISKWLYFYFDIHLYVLFLFKTFVCSNLSSLIKSLSFINLFLDILYLAQLVIQHTLYIKQPDMTKLLQKHEG